VSPAAPRGLARRLEALRKERWPDAGLTQAQLAEALGGGKPLSISLISSWENSDKPIGPPVQRLEAYATLFATRRSLDGQTLRVLPLDELTDEERDEREDLLDELLCLREGYDPAVRSTADPWTFPHDEDIAIVCAPLPEHLRAHRTYADPDSADFVSLYTYADPDSLIEVFGHIRSRNPDNQVTFHAGDGLAANTSHLVLLGGSTGTPWPGMYSIGSRCRCGRSGATTTPSTAGSGCSRTADRG
jgi:transcriptional regulator with XRE-family HTH domain